MLLYSYGNIISKYILNSSNQDMSLFSAKYVVKAHSRIGYLDRHVYWNNEQCGWIAETPPESRVYDCPVRGFNYSSKNELTLINYAYD